MKTIKLILLSIICVLAFCSCQKNYAELAQGKWRMDNDASYYEKNDKRHYANDYNKGKKTGNSELVFHEGTVEIYMSEEREDGTLTNEEKRTAKCHFDKDYFYVDGDAAHILKMNNKRMVLEGMSDDELTHMEFLRIEDKAFISFLANIWYSLPIWLWIVIGTTVVTFFIIYRWGVWVKVTHPDGSIERYFKLSKKDL